MYTLTEKIDEADLYGAASFLSIFSLLGITLRPQNTPKGDEIMANRTRNIQLKICLNEEEKQIFEKKMKLAKCKTMSHFLRKRVLEKEIYQVDLQPFADLQGLLYKATSNINQIAKRVNSTGIIYSDDINDMKKQIDHISKEIWQIHSLLLGRTTETGDDK